MILQFFGHNSHTKTSVLAISAYPAEFCGLDTEERAKIPYASTFRTIGRTLLEIKEAPSSMERSYRCRFNYIRSRKGMAPGSSTGGEILNVVMVRHASQEASSTRLTTYFNSL